MKAINKIHLKELPAVFRLDNGHVNTELLKDIISLYISGSKKRVQSLLQNICVNKDLSEDAFLLFGKRISDPDFREKWYELCIADASNLKKSAAGKVADKRKYPAALFSSVEAWVRSEANKSSRDLSSFDQFYLKRNGKRYPRLEQIHIFSEQLIALASVSTANAALFAWSQLESAEWGFIKTPKETSLNQFREVLLNDLSNRGEFEILKLLADGVNREANSQVIQFKLSKLEHITGRTSMEEISVPALGNGISSRAVVSESEVNSEREVNESSNFSQQYGSMGEIQHEPNEFGVSQEIFISPASPVVEVIGGAVGAECKAEKSIACWVLDGEDLFLQVEKLQIVLAEFANQSARLGALQSQDDFSDNGGLVSLFSSLESKRIQIRDRWRDIQVTMSSSCKLAGERQCSLQQGLLYTRSGATSSIGTLIPDMDANRKLAVDLVQDFQSGKVEFENLSVIERRLELQIGKANDKSTDLASDVYPCQIHSILDEKRIRVADLKIKVSELIQKRRSEIVNEIEGIAVNFKSPTTAQTSTAQDELSLLRVCVSEAQDIDGLESCALRIRQLSEKLRSENRSTVQTNAHRVADLPSDISAFLDLCEALCDVDEHVIAFALIFLRQRLFSLEEIVEVTDRALAIHLEACAKALRSGIPSPILWEALSLDPWLLGIGRNDIESQETLERLVILILAGVRSGGTEKAASILANVVSADQLRPSFPDALRRLVQAITTRRQVKFVSLEAVITRRQQVAEINERIAADGKKYRHVQCGKATHFVRFEILVVFPALEKLWRNIDEMLQLHDYGRAHSQINNVDVSGWYSELNRKCDRPVDEHPHYSQKIRTFMSEFVDLVRRHITHCERIGSLGQLMLEESAIDEAISLWENEQPTRTPVADAARQGLLSQQEGRPYSKSLLETLLECKPFIRRCPNAIPWLRANEVLEPHMELVDFIIGDLAVDIQLAEVTNILVADQAWGQLIALQTNSPELRPHEWITNYQLEEVHLSTRRGEVLETCSANEIQVFDSCIQGGRFPAARRIIDRVATIRREEHSRGMIIIEEQIRSQRERIDNIKDVADGANMPEEWQAEVYRIAATIDRQMRLMLRSENTGHKIDESQARITRAVDSLNFVVSERSKVFDEVLYHLMGATESNAPWTVTPEIQAQATDKCPDLIKNWKNLTVDVLDQNEKKRLWPRFVKEFSKISALYRDEQDEQDRFRFIQLSAYPFVVFETGFKKPQSGFLKRTLRLYLYRQRDVDMTSLRALEVELAGDGAPAWLHVVFAPQGAEKIRDYFRYDKGFKDFLIIDESFIYKICCSVKHDVPLRQSLHASVEDLSSSSPFVTQGYCHQSNNINVGRKDILTKLLNNKQSMIWGGRRIGKTSVLHSFNTALGNQPKKYRVAYVYADIQDVGDPDPDLAIAKQIGATLGLRDLINITDLGRQITELRREGQRFAFLIDEVDEYIKKSRIAHGAEFPLATLLRQLVMDDSSKDTILVYSGYHQLYYEAKLLSKEKRRVGHPFINIAHDIPIRDLTHDDVNELVRTGFEEMLGIDVSPEVPALISMRASRHPAFVQQFCRCLLEQVSKRRSPGKRVTITKEDVETVYSADANSDGGEQAFIFYVNETLGFNLSHLGRAIMTSICLYTRSLNAADGKGEYCSIQQIRGELNYWCDLIEIDHPELEHFQQSIDLLEMTNMLTQDPKVHGKYRVTYVTYVDILYRLDNLKKADVEDSLRQYDSKERKFGVIL